MPTREVDGQRIRAERRAADVTQEQLAVAVGVSKSAVANWEKGASLPDPEKLPALARSLGKALDDLFPRHGLPDLADLRGDAGLAQYEVAEVLGTKSAGPVANAERAKRRLSGQFVEPLAAAYGVSVERLLAAQQRSFGMDVPEPDDGVPTTLAEKMQYLLENGEGDTPGDAEVAEAVNGFVGAAVISEAGVRDLRTGVVTEASPPVLEGLSAAFGVSALFFRSSEAVAQQVAEGLTLLANVKSGKIRGIKGRQLGEEGLSDDVMALINGFVAEMEQKGIPETDLGK
ncbi:helix-turn-helix domain-containing protein [Streptomyces sp. 4.24]|uniref:helix-turn-helix domain-containing protein n=1 Tax=Streptomyces tritrimontium TaxID=3406573 RepID=UPI003BB66897